mmetsp:Transcript_4458/g.13197  ORF Transcript_4458/g.13197 Transcript_4458/m.13197 type:complete len:118 (-) Transcript_4458:1066-1419(-)
MRGDQDQVQDRIDRWRRTAKRNSDRTAAHQPPPSACQIVKSRYTDLHGCPGGDPVVADSARIIPTTQVLYLSAVIFRQVSLKRLPIASKKSHTMFTCRPFPSEWPNAPGLLGCFHHI